MKIENYTFSEEEIKKEVRTYILSNFNVAYDVETVRQLLKKRGLKLLRPK